MTRIRLIPALILALALSSNLALAQGKGQDKGNDKNKAAKVDHDKGQKADKSDNAYVQNKGSDKNKGNAQNNGSARKNDVKRNDDWKGNSKSYKHSVSTRNLNPSMQRYVTSKRMTERLAVGAVAYAFARGINSNDLVIVNSSDRVHVKNRKGDILIDMDDDRARNLGAWDVRPVRYDDSRSDGPAFCRSGAGHPNWGRQWCVDKGFGLGSDNDIRWGRTTNSIGDIVFGQQIVDKQTLLRDALIAAVGPVVLDRLGLHALTLGYTEPVTGVWVAQPTGPRVLMLNSGSYPIAEVVDTNRDNRADLMVVALRPW